MKSNLNKVTKLGYSNYGIAKRLGVSVALIHKNCKKVPHPLIEKSIKEHFFMKRPKLLKSTIEEEYQVREQTFIEKLMYQIRSFIYFIKRKLQLI